MRAFLLLAAAFVCLLLMRAATVAANNKPQCLEQGQLIDCTLLQSSGL